MKGQILEAGFTNIRVDASFDIYSAPADVAFIYDLANNWLLSPEMTEVAIMYGATTQELCDRIRATLPRWKDHPGAFAATAFGEAVASRP